MNERGTVYHYCSADYHLIHCTAMAVVTERPPVVLDDRELLWELHPIARFLEYLGEGEYQVGWRAAVSTQHSVSRVTYWHVCDEVAHAACIASSSCRAQARLEDVEEGQFAIRLHPSPDEVWWVPEDTLKGTGHYEVSTGVFAPRTHLLELEV